MWNFYQGIYKEKGNLGVLKENLIVPQREAGPRPVCILGSNVCLESTKTSVGTNGVEGMSVIVGAYSARVVKTWAMDVGGESKSGVEKGVFEGEGVWRPVHLQRSM